MVCWLYEDFSKEAIAFREIQWEIYNMSSLKCNGFFDDCSYSILACLDKTLRFSFMSKNLIDMYLSEVDTLSYFTMF